MPFLEMESGFPVTLGIDSVWEIVHGLRSSRWSPTSSFCLFKQGWRSGEALPRCWGWPPGHWDQVVGWVAWVFLTYTIEMVRLTVW